MTTSVKSPTTFANDNTAPFSGVAGWSTQSNAGASDNTYGTYTDRSANKSRGFKTTGYGFAIPVGATINGIEVNVERKGQTSSTCNDQFMRIVKGGVTGATDKGVVTNWNTSEFIYTYGSPTDLWGETWTYSDINSATFGNAFSAAFQSGGFETAYIDHVEITVHYTVAGGGGVTILQSSTRGVERGVLRGSA